VTQAFKTIRLETNERVATVWLDHPARRNAISSQMLSELYHALRVLEADRKIGIVVVRGAGQDFSVGADFKNAEARGVFEGGYRDGQALQAAVLLHEMPAVTIALISGACAGAGFGLACACDLRFASQSSRFNSAFLTVGLSGDMGGPWSLPRILGGAKARELYFFPRPFGSEEALRLGLVSAVFPDGAFDQETATLVTQLSSAAPLALRAMKQNFVDAEQSSLSSYVAVETERLFRLLHTEDVREAFKARADKRAPRFQGR
jgi:2-(1,2-epoxy-1,2-dihydrophenyl)acetyl-CoA isomerase